MGCLDPQAGVVVTFCFQAKTGGLLQWRSLKIQEFGSRPWLPPIVFLTPRVWWELTWVTWELGA